MWKPGCLSRRLAAPVLSLLLAGCAVSQQGNNTTFRFDQDELTAVKLQTFQLGSAQGVLRRTANQQYQIKLYDRMKLIDLGRLDNPRVVDTQRFAGYDLIAVHTPTRQCPYAHRLYEVKAQNVGMWDINNIPGKCGQPLSFASDGTAWLAQQEGGRSDATVWLWVDGKLASMLDPTKADQRIRQAGMAPAAPAQAPAQAAGSRRPAARFESGDAAVAGPPAAPADSASAGSTPAGAKPRIATAPATPAASSPTPARKIDAGRYTRLPSNGVTEMAPAKVTLRDAN